MADNNTANVSTGKGVKGGYFFRAPANDTNLNIIKNGGLKTFSSKVETIIATAENLGYISSDGWTISDDREIETYTDVNGDVINTGVNSRTETVKATLVEKKKATLATMWGDDNVTDAGGVIEALHTNDDPQEYIYIADLVLKNKRRWRYVVPLGQVTEVGDESIASGSLIGREITITGNSFNYAEGKTVTSIDWLESTETSESAESAESTEG